VVPADGLRDVALPQSRFSSPWRRLNSKPLGHAAQI
jgi:hypothetical protein